jgi:hypothetical protein
VALVGKEFVQDALDEGSGPGPGFFPKLGIEKRVVIFGIGQKDRADRRAQGLEIEILDDSDHGALPVLDPDGLADRIAGAQPAGQIFVDDGRGALVSRLREIPAGEEAEAEYGNKIGVASQMEDAEVQGLPGRSLTDFDFPPSLVERGDVGKGDGIGDEGCADHTGILEEAAFGGEAVRGERPRFDDAAFVETGVLISDEPDLGADKQGDDDEDDGRGELDDDEDVAQAGGAGLSGASG